MPLNTYQKHMQKELRKGVPFKTAAANWSKSKKPKPKRERKVQIVKKSKKPKREPTVVKKGSKWFNIKTGRQVIYK